MCARPPDCNGILFGLRATTQQALRDPCEFRYGDAIRRDALFNYGVIRWCRDLRP